MAMVIHTCTSRPENVPAFLEAVKRREKVLSGFGHRIYKTVSRRSLAYSLLSSVHEADILT
jgi:citrate synthase